MSVPDLLSLALWSCYDTVLNCTTGEVEGAEPVPDLSSLALSGPVTILYCTVCTTGEVEGAVSVPDLSSLALWSCYGSLDSLWRSLWSPLNIVSTRGVAKMREME